MSQTDQNDYNLLCNPNEMKLKIVKRERVCVTERERERERERMIRYFYMFQFENKYVFFSRVLRNLICLYGL